MIPVTKSTMFNSWVKFRFWAHFYRSLLSKILNSTALESPGLLKDFWGQNNYFDNLPFLFGKVPLSHCVRKKIFVLVFKFFAVKTARNQKKLTLVVQEYQRLYKFRNILQPLFSFVPQQHNNRKITSGSGSSGTAKRPAFSLLGDIRERERERERHD